MTPLPRIGVVIPTIGRSALVDLLRSLADSTLRPTAVVVANQAGHPLDLPTADLPFPVTVVASSGGASAARNDAVAALGADVDVVSFPNDDSLFPAGTLAQVAEVFVATPAPWAVSGTVADPDGPRFVLPPTGSLLDRRTVWLAVEPGMFVSRSALQEVGGFRADLGTGAPSPWGSGEGTDLLLRVLAHGGSVRSHPEVVVLGRGERRDLTAQQVVAKHRAYARGTGRVYRLHDYPPTALLRILVAPLVQGFSHDASPTQSLRLARARFLGRLEGLRGAPYGDRDSAIWRPPPPR